MTGLNKCVDEKKSFEHRSVTGAKALLAELHDI